MLSVCKPPHIPVPGTYFFIFVRKNVCPRSVEMATACVEEPIHHDSHADDCINKALARFHVVRKRTSRGEELGASLFLAKQPFEASL